jgi:hypothetical protein
LPGLVLAPVRAGLGRPETRMPLVAFTTVAILKAPPGDPAVQGFFDRLPETFGAADAFEGFVARSTRDPVTLRHSWGDPVQPRFYDPARHAGVVFTLSLWRSLEPVNAFAYSGVHGEALRHRLEWFLEPEWPSYAAWWVDDGHVPDWHEASRRLEHLHDHGASPEAFGFRTPFGPDGAPIEIDRAAVVALARRASARGAHLTEREAERDGILRALKAGADGPRQAGGDANGGGPSSA